MSEDLMQSTQEEQEFWLSCVQGLPGLQGFSGTGYDKFGERIPYGTGPHSLKAFFETFNDIVKPKSVLEIGFNLGYASAVFLKITNSANIISCDISYKDETLAAADILKLRYPNRFVYFNRNSTDYLEWITFENFDLAFVDGSHYYEDVCKDIEFCISLNIPYLLFDDVLPAFGRVQEAIDAFPSLILVKSFGNIALYKNTTI